MKKILLFTLFGWSVCMLIITIYAFFMLATKQLTMKDRLPTWTDQLFGISSFICCIVIIIVAICKHKKILEEIKGVFNS